MTDFNDEYDADEMASYADEERKAAREDAAEEHAERHGFGVCRRGTCFEPCGPTGGCVQ